LSTTPFYDFPILPFCPFHPLGNSTRPGLSAHRFPLRRTNACHLPRIIISIHLDIRIRQETESGERPLRTGRCNRQNPLRTTGFGKGINTMGPEARRRLAGTRTISRSRPATCGGRRREAGADCFSPVTMEQTCTRTFWDFPAWGSTGN
jgi:hypothetical protein